MPANRPDPLADVFEGTEDAPLPKWAGGREGQPFPWLVPGVGDRRWEPQRRDERERETAS